MRSQSRYESSLPLHSGQMSLNNKSSCDVLKTNSSSEAVMMSNTVQQ